MKFSDFFRSKPQANQTPLSVNQAKTPEKKVQKQPEDDWLNLIQVKKPTVVPSLTTKIDRNLPFADRSNQAWPHFTKGFTELAASRFGIPGLVLSSSREDQNSNYEKIKNDMWAKRDFQPFYDAFSKAVANVINRMTAAVPMGSNIQQLAIKKVNEIAKQIGLID